MTLIILKGHWDLHTKFNSLVKKECSIYSWEGEGQVFLINYGLDCIAQSQNTSESHCFPFHYSLQILCLILGISTPGWMYKSLYLILRAITTQFIVSSTRAWWSYILLMKHRTIRQMGDEWRLQTSHTKNAAVRRHFSSKSMMDKTLIYTFEGLPWLGRRREIDINLRD